MKKVSDNRFSFDQPKRRPLKIYASDPMVGRNLGNRARVDVENEPLQPGPMGERIWVVDYNSTKECYYPPINLDDPNILMQGGLDPTESDPRFHQQMVYAVAMRTLENFDRALGRRIYLNRKRMPLRIFPHAFYGANAYFDESLHAVLFGYFRADSANPGQNLPGQTVFTCLSHDIIAHEMTHAIVNRLRRNFLEASNVDVLAFHEGFSDLVALFQHFSFPDVLRNQIQRSGSDLRKANDLLELAQQFGHATATGQALRSALGVPELRLSDDVVEPHDRGAILVAAVFDAFLLVYERRTSDLIRLASTQSDGIKGLHPDLVARLATEAARIAQSMLTICIRAFDYMPPVDVTFGDFLRAMVTADVELSPDDELGLRAALIEGFRLRGIYPEGVSSLAEESLLWDAPDSPLPKLKWEPTDLLPVIVDAANRLSSGVGRADLDSAGSDDDASPSAKQYIADEADVDPADEPVLAESKASISALSRVLGEYAKEHAALLMLDPKKKIRPLGVHPVFRVSPNGRLVIELVAQVDQRISDSDGGLGGMPLRGGTTLIVSFDGTVKYAVAKPVPFDALPAKEKERADARLDRQKKFLAASDLRDPALTFMDERAYAVRAQKRGRMATLHMVR